MASAIKKCRVCGKEYEACRSARPTPNTFRWQEVSCSPECGAIYLQRINESRGLVEPKKAKRKKYFEEVPVVQETPEVVKQEEVVIPEDII